MTVRLPYKAAIYRSTLNRLQQDFLSVLMGHASSQEIEYLQDYEILFFWVGRAFHETRRMPADEWQVAVSALAEDVLTYGQRVCDAVLADSWQQSEPFRLAIADGKYLTWTGHPGFINLKLSKKLPQLPQPAMEVVSIDLLVLFVRAYKFCSDATDRLNEIEQRAARRSG
jgi:hypothetical protein